ncbi:hypothetical protein JKP88DRAFT_279160 [Tribonema minus]|uniref:Uncharacterized protein n=1 Tax=Tribonema minus TaxID=303371 RepID=A0A835YTJ5_9STRA|nr:hypothetical protein JKP88DRAFT_279160 [Tribonema minus]
MCYSATASIVNWIFGTAGCALLMRRHGLAEGVFYLVVVQMQLVEFLLHANPTCGGANATASIAGMLINHLEPMALWAGVHADPSCGRPPRWLYSLMRLYTAAAVLYTLYALGVQCTVVTPVSAPHLDWTWNYSGPAHDLFYALFLVVVNSISAMCLADGAVRCALLTASYVASYAVYGATHSVGAMWCFAATAGPYLLLAYKWLAGGDAFRHPPRRLRSVAEVCAGIARGLRRRLSYRDVDFDREAMGAPGVLLSTGRPPSSGGGGSAGSASLRGGSSVTLAGSSRTGEPRSWRLYVSPPEVGTNALSVQYLSEVGEWETAQVFLTRT